MGIRSAYVVDVTDGETVRCEGEDALADVPAGHELVRVRVVGVAWTPRCPLVGAADLNSIFSTLGGALTGLCRRPVVAVDSLPNS